MQSSAGENTAVTDLLKEKVSLVERSASHEEDESELQRHVSGALRQQQQLSNNLHNSSLALGHYFSSSSFDFDPTEVDMTETERETERLQDELFDEQEEFYYENFFSQHHHHHNRQLLQPSFIEPHYSAHSQQRRGRRRRRYSDGMMSSNCADQFMANENRDENLHHHHYHHRFSWPSIEASQLAASAVAAATLLNDDGSSSCHSNDCNNDEPEGANQPLIPLSQLASILSEVNKTSDDTCTAQQQHSSQNYPYYHERAERGKHLVSSTVMPVRRPCRRRGRRPSPPPTTVAAATAPQATPAPDLTLGDMTRILAHVNLCEDANETPRWDLIHDLAHDGGGGGGNSNNNNSPPSSSANAAAEAANAAANFSAEGPTRSSNINTEVGTRTPQRSLATARSSSSLDRDNHDSSSRRPYTLHRNTTASTSLTVGEDEESLSSSLCSKQRQARLEAIEVAEDDIIIEEVVVQDENNVQQKQSHDGEYSTGTRNHNDREAASNSPFRVHEDDASAAFSLHAQSHSVGSSVTWYEGSDIVEVEVTTDDEEEHDSEDDKKDAELDAIILAQEDTFLHKVVDIADDDYSAIANFDINDNDSDASSAVPRGMYSPIHNHGNDDKNDMRRTHDSTSEYARFLLGFGEEEDSLCRHRRRLKPRSSQQHEPHQQQQPQPQPQGRHPPKRHSC